MPTDESTYPITTASPAPAAPEAGDALHSDEGSARDVLHYEADQEPTALDYLERFSLRLSSTRDYDAPEEEEEPEPLLREDVEPAPAYCTRPFKTGCDRCQRACPHGAIAFDDETATPTIIEERCTNCGLCAGVCDGFCMVRITLDDLVEKACRLAKDDESVFFACNDLVDPDQELAHNAIMIPCLGAVPPEFWAALAFRGVHANVCVDFAACQDCYAAGAVGPMLYEHAIATAEAWTGTSVGFAETVPYEQGLIETLMGDANAQADRRNMLGALTGKATDVATGEHRRRSSSTVEEFHERRERLRAEGRINQHKSRSLSAIANGGRDKRLWPRRTIILEGLGADAERGEALPIWVARINEGAQDGVQACPDACPTTACSSVDDEIVIDPTHCIACGACQLVAAEGAIDFVETTAAALVRSQA